jgi:hypothetical protein
MSSTPSQQKCAAWLIHKGTIQGPLASSRPGVDGSQRLAGSHLVLKNTGRPASNSSAIRVLQAVLRNSSRSRSQRSLLHPKPKHLNILLTVDSLTDRPATLPRYSRRSPKVIGGSTTFDYTSG